MKMFIRVGEMRTLCPENFHIGTIGENKATELVFVLPESLQGYDVSLICVTGNGSFRYELENNSLKLPQEVLTDNTLGIQLILTDSGDVVWKSKACVLELYPTLDTSGENVVDKAKDAAREECCAELARRLSELTGKDFSDADFETLLAALPSLMPTEEEKNLVEWAKHERFIISRCKKMPAALDADFYLTEDEENGIFTEETEKYLAYCEDGTTRIRLPEYPTVHVDWADAWFNDNIRSLDIDVSTMDMENQAVMFANSVTAADDVTLRGIQNATTLEQLWGGTGDGDTVSVFRLVETGESPEGITYSDNYWEQTFINTSAKCIFGELDLSKGTYNNGLINTFTYSTRLRYFRVKPRSISRDISFVGTTEIVYGSLETDEKHPGTILSILNGIRDWVDEDTTPKFVVSFATSTQEYIESVNVAKNNTSGDFVWTEDDTTDCGEPMTLTDAFVSKGVIVYYSDL